MLDKNKFNKLDIDEQIKVFNEAIKKYGSINQASKQIGIPKSTIRDRFKTHGYKYDPDNKEYMIKVEVLENRETKETNNIYHHNDYAQNRPHEDKEIINIENDKNIIILNEESTQAIQFVVTNLNKLQEVIENLDTIKQSQITQKMIVPKFQGEKKRTTIKVDLKIWERYTKFAENSPYDKEELTTLAFKEFLEKYDNENNNEEIEN